MVIRWSVFSGPRRSNFPKSLVLGTIERPFPFDCIAIRRIIRTLVTISMVRSVSSIKVNYRIKMDEIVLKRVKIATAITNCQKPCMEYSIVGTLKRKSIFSKRMRIIPLITREKAQSVTIRIGRERILRIGRIVVLSIPRITHQRRNAFQPPTTQIPVFTSEWHGRNWAKRKRRSAFMKIPINIRIMEGNWRINFLNYSIFNEIINFFVNSIFFWYNTLNMFYLHAYDFTSSPLFFVTLLLMYSIFTSTGCWGK